MKLKQFDAAIHVIIVSIVFILIGRRAEAQQTDQVRIAFQNIRSDDVPNNACHSANWLLTYREQLKILMLDELYRTDRQGQAAIVGILLNTKSFRPDNRFLALLMRYVNHAQDPFGKVHDVLWNFLDKHYAGARSYLAANLQRSGDMNVIWNTVSLFSLHNDLALALQTIDKHTFQVACKNLEDDNVPGNAGESASFFLMIGEPALPYLGTLTGQQDVQARDFALALVDAIHGSRKAYGYLGSQVILKRGVLGGQDAPEWIHSLIKSWNPETGVHRKYF